jgi:ESS family glutamate:Na+ symporter
MHPLVQSLVVFVFILVAARFIKRNTQLLKNFFIPSALVAGLLGLIFGPQLIGAIPSDITNYWGEWPKYLITVVFAGLFLGKTIPSVREIWRTAGPMIAFGNTLAWGQYVLGILAVLLFLGPLFGANPLAGALIEISFEGGHGTAAGLAPTFESLGWSEGTDIALGLATVSIIAAIVTGILLVNWHTRRGGGQHTEVADVEKQHKQMIRSGYNLIALGRKIQSSPKAVAINVLAFTLSIALGWVMLQGLIWAENTLVGGFTHIRFFEHLPLFPLAMLGGLFIQIFLRKIGQAQLISRRTAGIISTLALDALIASAIATVSLSAIGNNLPIFLTFAVLGIAWIIFGFLVLAPRMFKHFWFEKGLTNMGQSMGMTATGLLLGRLADPTNKSEAKESFAYKQLAFEPFMGGGIVTAGAVIVLYEFGQVPVLIATTIITLFWLVLGLWLGRRD